MRSTFIYFLFLMFFTSHQLNAQKAVLAAGSNAIGVNGAVAYSVGQIDYTSKGSNSQIMEGVQQAYEITTLSTAETFGSEKKDILLYPNPFKDFVFLDFTANDYSNSDYRLYDSSGKLVKEGKIKESKSELNFSDIPSAMYNIRINQNGKNIKTFKIIKK